jgi:hypothetical protein
MARLSDSLVLFCLAVNQALLDRTKVAPLSFGSQTVLRLAWLVRTRANTTTLVRLAALPERHRRSAVMQAASAFEPTQVCFGP